eukprot:7381642-Prymnesium_polylepis.1
MHGARETQFGKQLQSAVVPMPQKRRVVSRGGALSVAGRSPPRCPGERLHNTKTIKIHNMALPAGMGPEQASKRGETV